MGLIDLKTDLKSLRYGNDRPGGGSSNQPYIVTPIPDGLTANGPDFLLRQGALQASVTDSVRITKWFSDLSSTRGLLFTAKQLALERLNFPVPGTPNRIYSPTSTILQVGSLFTGAHLNKRGLNPFELGYADNGERGYFKFAQRLNNIINNNSPYSEGEGRLTILYKAKIISFKGYKEDGSDQATINFGTDIYGVDQSSDNILLSYDGGPNAILGLGKTSIRIQNPTIRTFIKADGSNPNNVFTYRSDDFNKEIQTHKIGNIIIDDFRRRILAKYAGKEGIQVDLPYTPYERFSRENPEKGYGVSKTVYLAAKGARNNPNATLNPDTINLTEIISSDDPKLAALQSKDLVSFYFEILNPKNQTSDSGTSSFLFFRAYITELGDSFKSEHQNYKYVGRAENFYKYSGFSRDVSLGFTIYAHSRDEMIPLYKKINNLVGVTAPTYSDQGFMMGNILKITVGNYFNNMPGILNSISLKPSFEAGWDINRTLDGTILKPKDKEYVGQLPRMIEVSMNFTPIHTFAPQYGEDFINRVDRPQRNLQPMPSRPVPTRI